MAHPKLWTTTILKTNAKEIVLQKNKNIMNVYNHIRFTMTLGYSSVNSNQILQPNIAVGGANPSNSHFTNSFGSIVGGTTGCGGAGGSAAALAGNGNPGYNIVQQKGGKKCARRSHNKQGGHKRRSHNKQGGHKRRSHNKQGGRNSKRKSKKRIMRGGLSAMSPASFSGANAPYQQFGNQPLSFNYGIGSATPLPPNLIGLANNNMMNIHNNCGPDYGLVSPRLLN
jgi:hypothetical protein